jgi:hypothetical protein
MMKRFLLATAPGLAALALAIPAAASAQIVELGQTTSAPVIAPTCPTGVAAANCLIILTHTTALQGVTNGMTNPTKVTKAGWIVSFTVGLSNLTSDAKTELGFIHGLDTEYGGTPQLALTVLKPGSKNKYTVVAQSGVYHLIPFLGSVLQEPLSLPPSFSTLTALPVKPGEVVGLTVPTWAPVLSYNLTASKYSYSQSRSTKCKFAAGSPQDPVQTAQTTVGASTTYGCTYTGTRVQYSATEIVNQPYPKTYVGGPTTTKKTTTKKTTKK